MYAKGKRNVWFLHLRLHPPPRPPSKFSVNRKKGISSRFFPRREEWSRFLCSRLSLLYGYFSEENNLPKPAVVKNGLRSNSSKTTTNSEKKPIWYVVPSNARHFTTDLSQFLTLFDSKRRRRRSSGTRPPFYTDIIEFDGETSPHRDFRLPSDVIWNGQQQQQAETWSSTASSASSAPASTTDTVGLAPKKKKSTRPKQKQPVPCKQVQRNVYTDQLRQSLQASSNAEEAPVCDCKPPDTCEDGSCMNRMIYTECLPTCACGKWQTMRRKLRICSSFQGRSAAIKRFARANGLNIWKCLIPVNMAKAYARHRLLARERFSANTSVKSSLRRNFSIACPISTRKMSITTQWSWRRIWWSMPIA